MTKIMKKMQWYGWRTYMGNAGAFVQLTVGNELRPESNGIVVQTHEADIGLIKFGLIKWVLTGKIYSLALHAASQKGREAEVLSKHIAP